LSIDPLADKYHGHSPYNYVMGKPVNMVDPMGMSPEGEEEWPPKNL